MKWKLNWKEYIERGEILTEPNVTTFVARYESEEKARSVFSELRKWLTENGLDIKIKKEDKELDTVILQAVSGNNEILAEKGYGDYIIARSNNPSYTDSVRMFLGQHYVLETPFIAELPHKKRKFELKKHAIMGLSLTGITTKTESILDLFPYTYYELKKGRKIIGKAILSYYNHEMDDCAPVIKLFEIIEEYSGYGIGTKLLQIIEEDAYDSGFDRIWASDTKSVEFWMKAGYEIDIDEGFKSLEEF